MCSSLLDNPAFSRVGRAAGALSVSLPTPPAKTHLKPSAVYPGVLPCLKGLATCGVPTACLTQKSTDFAGPLLLASDSNAVYIRHNTQSIPALHTFCSLLSR